MIQYDGPVKFTYKYAGPSDEVHVVVQREPACTCCQLTDPDYHRIDLPAIGCLAGTIDVVIRDPWGEAVTTNRVLEAVQAALDATQDLDDVKATVVVDDVGYEIHIDSRQATHATSGNSVQ